MKIKQSRGTSLANNLLKELEESGRDFSNAVATMIYNKDSQYQCGYHLYEKTNDRYVDFYGHNNFDKYKIHFDSQIRFLETDSIEEAKDLIISFLFFDENNETLNKLLG
jgi:hypothetical protein